MSGLWETCAKCGLRNHYASMCLTPQHRQTVNLVHDEEEEEPEWVNVVAATEERVQVCNAAGWRGSPLPDRHWVKCEPAAQEVRDSNHSHQQDAPHLDPRGLQARRVMSENSQEPPKRVTVLGGVPGV